MWVDVYVCGCGWMCVSGCGSVWVWVDVCGWVWVGVQGYGWVDVCGWVGVYVCGCVGGCECVGGWVDVNVWVGGWVGVYVCGCVGGCECVGGWVGVDAGMGVGVDVCVCVCEWVGGCGWIYMCVCGWVGEYVCVCSSRVSWSIVKLWVPSASWSSRSRITSLQFSTLEASLIHFKISDDYVVYRLYLTTSRMNSDRVFRNQSCILQYHWKCFIITCLRKESFSRLDLVIESYSDVFYLLFTSPIQTSFIYFLLLLFRHLLFALCSSYSDIFYLLFISLIQTSFVRGKC